MYECLRRAWSEVMSFKTQSIRNAANCWNNFYLLFRKHKILACLKYFQKFRKSKFNCQKERKTLPWFRSAIGPAAIFESLVDWFCNSYRILCFINFYSKFCLSQNAPKLILRLSKTDNNHSINRRLLLFDSQQWWSICCVWFVNVFNEAVKKFMTIYVVGFVTVSPEPYALCAYEKARSYR